MKDEQEKKQGLLTLTAPELVEAAPDLLAPDVENPAFLHAILCQVGLPRAKVKERTFVRTSGTASMLLEAGHYRDMWGKWQNASLPYGTKPRLLMFHICSEVVRTRAREIDLGGSMRQFLDRIGITFGGPEVRRFKEQSRALAAMRMNLSYQTPDKLVNINTQPISRFDAWMSGDNLNSQGQLWPDELVVAQEFADTLLAHAVPLDPAAIRTLQGSSLALDVYTWLSHRLCRIRKDAGLPLYWFSLRGQFGQEYKSDKDFKREFLKALTAAKAVYPDARVEQVRGGIRLYPSPPPVKKSQVVVQLAPPKPVLRPDQIHLKPETMDKVREAAPGWDKYHLEGLWRDWIATKAGVPNDPDKAFLAWCRKFTKGKRP
jgi:hypothetical protein